ncbi:hypothetical protein BJ138DRAFT_1152933 [Hygrophoropsis aurantiaca]|uniref:Uncharacterized protein n=1 Tax=Hygrophoropsis aurantiaca TaxID=72124 RepID=A0ACB8AAT9_9AGAM|nr:hypothetical protein BJ138DRAFT_1152933 [Hygrophoropsis aurantiaca]
MSLNEYLPTLDRLGGTVSPKLDVASVTFRWFDSFAQDMFWRDMLSLTWDSRTFQSINKVRQFLTNQLPLFPTCKLRRLWRITTVICKGSSKHTLRFVGDSFRITRPTAIRCWP